MKNEQKKIQTKRYIGIIVGIIILLFFMMPICYIQSVEVKNNKYYSSEDIIKTSGIKKGHLLDLDYFKAKEELLNLPYVANANIEYEFPGKVTIDLVEKAPFAYVKFKGTFLCLNQQGQVIEQSQEKHHKLPVISGIAFDYFKNAETLPILNQDNWLTATQVLEELERYNYLEKVSEIDVHNLDEIHLYVDKLDVIMGDIGDFDKKIEVLIQVYDVNGFSMGELTIDPKSKDKLATLTPIT